MTDQALNEPPALFEASPFPVSPAAPTTTANRAAERLLALGAETLDARELLAVIVGGPGAERAAEGLLAQRGGLPGLARCSLFDLLEAPGIGEARAAAVLAASELGRRLVEASRPLRPVVSSPADVDAHLRPRMAGLEQETFVVLVLNTKNEVIASPTIGVGTLSSCGVHAREVFRGAVKAAAASVILAHNHPSGDTTPSPEDIRTTRRMVEAGELLGISVLDHVIIGRGHHSLKESGHM